MSKLPFFAYLQSVSCGSNHHAALTTIVKHPVLPYPLSANLSLPLCQFEALRSAPSLGLVFHVVRLSAGFFRSNEEINRCLVTHFLREKPQDVSTKESWLE